MEEEQVHSYQVFNESNWQYNVNKVFFIVMLSFLLTLIKLYAVDFNITTPLLFLRIVASMFDMLLILALIEVVCAIIVKIGISPGGLLETRFKDVGMVIFKTFKESYARMMYFKPVYRTVNLYANNFIVHSSGKVFDYSSVSNNNFTPDWKPDHLK